MEESREAAEKLVPDVDLVELISSTATIDENSIVFNEPYTVLDDDYVKIQVKSVERKLLGEGTTDERYQCRVNVTIENKSQDGTVECAAGTPSYINDYEVTFANSNVTAGPGEKNEDAGYVCTIFTNEPDKSSAGSEYIESVEDLLTFYAALNIDLNGEHDHFYVADISLADAIVAVNAPESAKKDVITFDTPYTVLDDENVTVQVKSVERKLVGRGMQGEHYASKINLVVENKNEEYSVCCTVSYPDIRINGQYVEFLNTNDRTEPGEKNENIWFECDEYRDDPDRTNDGSEYIESAEDLLTLEGNINIELRDVTKNIRVKSYAAEIALTDAPDSSADETTAAASAESPAEGEIVFDSPYTLLDNDDVTIQAKSVEIVMHNEGTTDEYYEEKINLIIVNKNDDCSLTCYVGIPSYINGHEVSVASGDARIQSGETKDTAYYGCLVYSGDPSRHSSDGSECIKSVEDLLTFRATVCIEVKGARRDCYYADISLQDAAGK